MRAYYTPRAFYNYDGTLTDLQAQANVLAANASTRDTHGYEYCVINDETSATVTAKGNVYLVKCLILSLTLLQANISPPTTALQQLTMLCTILWLQAQPTVQLSL